MAYKQSMTHSITQVAIKVTKAAICAESDRKPCQKCKESTTHQEQADQYLSSQHLSIKDQVSTMN